jgi:von Willebrand factor type A domain
VSARAGLRTLLAAAAALGCAASDAAAPSDVARVSVEVLRGFSPDDVAPRESTAPVVMLLDATRSMSEPTRKGASHWLAAQRAAARFANDLPSQRAIWLYELGAADARDCQNVYRGSRAANAAARGPLLEEIRAVRPQGEGALAQALETVRDELWRGDTLLGARVIVFSDFVPECGGDVCAAAAKLITGGARLDVVAIGEMQVPACLRETTGLAEGLPPPTTADAPVHFRIEVAKPEPMVVGCSDAGGLPVAAPAGRGTVVVELDPPLRVEAYFAAGRRHVLQVLDFPALEPETRHWRWMDTKPETAAAEAP